MLTDDRSHSDLTGIPATADRRMGKPHQSVLLVGKVRRVADETACLVHDLSANGLRARFSVPPLVGEEIWVEVRGMPAMRATVRWVKGHKAGMQFVEPQPVQQVFQLMQDDGQVTRSPRFPLLTAASVRFEAGRFPAEVLDISAGGMTLATTEPVEQGEIGQVMLTDTGPPRFGKVCWTRHGQFGFRFANPLPLETLALLIAG